MAVTPLKQEISASGLELDEAETEIVALRQAALAARRLRRYYKPRAIVEILDSPGQPVRLIKMSWLIAFANVPDAMLPRRQDLPDEAFVPSEQLLTWFDARKTRDRIDDHLLPLIVISYCWRTCVALDPSALTLVSSLCSYLPDFLHC